jgi:hypothetical protein
LSERLEAVELDEEEEEVSVESVEEDGEEEGVMIDTTVERAFASGVEEGGIDAIEERSRVDECAIEEELVKVCGGATELEVSCSAVVG